LCRIVRGEIQMDKREHERYEWIPISDLNNYDLVPGLKTDLKILGVQT